jgi:hypothetical protein
MFPGLDKSASNREAYQRDGDIGITGKCLVAIISYFASASSTCEL